MKNNKNSLMYFVTALICFVASILWFVSGGHNGYGFMWLGFGFAFLCLSVLINKKKNNERK